MESKTFIPLTELIKDYQIKDYALFANYLLEIWRDLSKRNSMKKGIDRLSFTSYYDIPLLLSERLFKLFDKDSNGYLNAIEFIEGMMMLFAGQFSSLAKFIFKFYDFDNDKIINKEDVRIVLSHLPLRKNITFEDRINSQQEISNVIMNSFKENKELSYQQFESLIENNNSDIFIFVLMFLLENRPFSNGSLKLIKADKEMPNKVIISRTPTIEFRKIVSPSMNSQYFVSPALKKRTITLIEEKQKMLNLYSGKEKNEMNFHVISSNNKDEPKAKKIRNTINMIEDKLTLNPNFSFLEPGNKETSQTIETSDKDIIEKEGYLYKLSSTKELKRVYFKLENKDLFFYSTKSSVSHKGIHNLSGVFLKKNEPVMMQMKRYYTFSLIYPNKIRTYYTDINFEYATWISSLSQSLNTKNLFELYDIKEGIGKGKFGFVKRAIHKKTKEEYAIKIMPKDSMTLQDLELAQTEINIMKMCQHPNIIKLYDIYESADFIYIIMEYCKGGDLFSYLEKRRFKLSEYRVVEIIHKLSMALYYIHSFNIVHRDLKPENILMTDTSEEADIRLVDFGLSKIIYPNEKMIEPYGTLSYVAPEVLLEEPYDKSADMWALGVVTYLLLSGYLPFDDKNSEREIARKTIQEEPKYTEGMFMLVSKKGKEFVKGLLKKNPTERMTIEEVLIHDWFKKYGLVPNERFNDKETEKGNQFVFYTSNIINTI